MFYDYVMLCLYNASGVFFKTDREHFINAPLLLFIIIIMISRDKAFVAPQKCNFSPISS